MFRKLPIIIFLFVFIISSCLGEKMFVQLRNGNIRAPDGTEYAFFSNEGFIETFGDSSFLGKIKFEKAELKHLVRSIKTGMYSCDDRNMDILYRVRPDNEWRTYYRKSSLPKIEFIPENCIRFEFLHSKELREYENSISFGRAHLTCNEGIIDSHEIQLFLNDLRNEKSPREAGLYKMIANEEGFLENCYVIGLVYGYFENEKQFAICYNVISFNELAYSIDTNFGKYVLPIEWLEKLGFNKNE